MSAEPMTPPAEPIGVARTADGSDGSDGAGGLWSKERASLIVGLVLTITLVAFEALAIATVMPDVKDDLGGLGLYGWVFSAFMLTSLLGIVVAGQLADRHGLVLPYVAGLSLFAAGLVVGGFARSMPILIVGRALQGFGAGAIPATGYTAIGRAIPAPLRPKMFAVLSTAWVVPGVVGPTAALGIEHLWSWRAVFLVLVPLVAVAGAMTVRGLASVDGAPVDPDQVPSASSVDDKRARGRLHLRQVSLLIVGVASIQAATSGVSVGVAVALVVLGAPLAIRSLLHLLPPGTLRLSPGVPATVAGRGILTFAFFAADAYVPLAVVDGRDGPAWVSGLALTTSALAWAAGSWLQARLIDRYGPRLIDQLGFAALAAGIGVLVLVAQGAPLAIVVAAWTLGGFGIGFAYAPQAVTVLASARPGEEGAASASIQLSDGLGIALGTGLAGGVVSLGDGLGWTVAQSVTLVFALALVGALAGIGCSARMPERVPDQAT